MCIKIWTSVDRPLVKYWSSICWTHYSWNAASCVGLEVDFRKELNVATDLTGHLYGTVERGHISHLVPYSSECMHGGGVVPVLHIRIPGWDSNTLHQRLFEHGVHFITVCRNQSFKYWLIDRKVGAVSNIIIFCTIICPNLELTLTLNFPGYFMQKKCNLLQHLCN